jgi:hypothetical protein
VLAHLSWIANFHREGHHCRRLSSRRSAQSILVKCASVLSMPLALGSWHGLLPFVRIFLALVWRLLDEGKFVEKNSPGCADHEAQVRWLLILRFW